MSGSIQPTGPQNLGSLQIDAVENQSVGKFKDWEIIDNPNSCFKGFPEKVSDGFSFARSFGRAWRAVKEGIIAFFQKLFGKKSKAPTVQVQVGMGHVSAGKIASFVGSQQPSGVIGSSTQTMYPTEKPTETTVPPKPKVSHNTEVSIPKTSVNDRQSVSPKTTVHEGDLPKPTISQALSSLKEKRQDVLGGSAQPTSIPSKSLNTAESNASPVSPQPSSATSSTQSTASVKKNVSSSLSQCRLVDVPGDGNCGLYAVLVGMRSINPSEFGKPTHPDQGPHPLPNEEQKFFVKQLRSGAAKIAKEQLGEKNGSYSKESLKTIHRLEKQYQELADDDFKYVAQVVGQPIEVYSQQPGGFARTLFQPNGETTFLFPDDSDPSDKNIIRLHLDGGHYQLMVPD